MYISTDFKETGKTFLYFLTIKLILQKQLSHTTLSLPLLFSRLQLQLPLSNPHLQHPHTFFLQGISAGTSG